MPVRRLQEFVNNLQQDLKGFAYWCLLLTLFRLAFIFIYRGQLDGVGAAAVGQALFLGLRLSLKTCGFIMLGGALFASLPVAFWPAWPARKVRLAWHSLLLLLFSVAFMARLPYYEIFHSAFDIMLLNFFYDDQRAIFQTAVYEYRLVERLAGALLMAAGLVYAYWRLLGRFEASQRRYSWFQLALILVLLPLFGTFCRLGGTLSSASHLNWENAGRLSSHLLNEAILDDAQALERVYRIKRYKSHGVAEAELSPDQLADYIAKIGGVLTASSLDGSFTRVVAGPRLSRQPHDVVLILGETFAIWPFLEPFKELGLVEQMAALAASPKGAQVATMLPAGKLTIQAVNSLLTGLPSAGVFPNHQPTSFADLYLAGAASIMRALGYRTVFWYGGYSEWQRLKNFVLAQGFAEFHSANEMGRTEGNFWGQPDKNLFSHIMAYMEEEQEKTFHLILTVSNHAPFVIDVDGEGFPRAQVKAKLTEDIADDDKTLTQLGHIWYADQTMGRFVKEAEALRPDTLFVITGDHSERFAFVKEQDIRTRYLVPCIFYGQGVEPAWSEAASLGSHMQLPGTLAELLGPPGFQYCAYWPNIFAQPGFVFNHRFYADGTELRELEKEGLEAGQVHALRRLAVRRVTKGDALE